MKRKGRKRGGGRKEGGRELTAVISNPRSLQEVPFIHHLKISCCANYATHVSRAKQRGIQKRTIITTLQAFLSSLLASSASCITTQPADSKNDSVKTTGLNDLHTIPYLLACFSLPQLLPPPPNVPLYARRAHPKSWSYARPFALNTGLAAGLRLSWLPIYFTGCCCGCPAACLCVGMRREGT